MKIADPPLKIVFMGTPGFAAPVLPALMDAGHDIAGVYTQPDRPSGRGRRSRPSGVKALAVERGLRVFQPESLRRDEGARRDLASLGPDLTVVAAYGLYIPSDVLAAPRLGCLNIHPSLLPLYRGPSPVASAILNGDGVSGVTVMVVTERMDAGPIVAQKETPIGPEETTPELTARLFQMGAELLLEVLPGWQRGDIRPREQDESRATLTRRLSRDDGRIDWSRPAAEIARRVRAYDPWPGSFTYWRGKMLKMSGVSVLPKPAAGRGAGRGRADTRRRGDRHGRRPHRARQPADRGTETGRTGGVRPRVPRLRWDHPWRIGLATAALPPSVLFPPIPVRRGRAPTSSNAAEAAR